MPTAKSERLYVAVPELGFKVFFQSEVSAGLFTDKLAAQGLHPVIFYDCDPFEGYGLTFKSL